MSRSAPKESPQIENSDDLDTTAANGRRVAVIGSGIAGLTAAFECRRRGADVVLFERAAAHGIAAKGIQVPSEGQLQPVDVPLRVFGRRQWPRLLALATQMGVTLAPVSLASSFQNARGVEVFAYRNARYGTRTLPYPADLDSAIFMRHIVRIMHDMRRLSRSPDKLANIAFEELLRAWNRDAVRYWLLPSLATICTCHHDDLLRYPAALLVRCFDRLVQPDGLYRLAAGSGDLAKALTRDVNEVRLCAAVESVRCVGERVVVTADGTEENFDAVIVATQANDAAELLEPDDPRTELLRGISYLASDVVVHKAARSVDSESGPQSTSTMWFRVAKDGNSSQSTVRVADVAPNVSDRTLLQTWNPLDALPADEVVHRTVVQRPIVTLQTQQRVRQLARMLGPVQFCGSYADEGVPLLETGVTSAQRAARRVTSG